MVYEDFLTYTEVDPDEYLSVFTHGILASAMIKNTAAYVKKDYGGNHFGDFEHLLEVQLTSIDDGAIGVMWMLSSNSETNTHNDGLANNEAIALYFYRADLAYRLTLINFVDDSSDTYGMDAPPNIYYLTIKRVGTAGTVVIYSDAARTAELDTLTLTVPSTKYRYLIAVASREAAGTEKITYIVNRLDLQEPPVEVGGMILRRPMVQANPLSNI